jgi:hypothetical protein
MELQLQNRLLKSQFASPRSHLTTGNYRCSLSAVDLNRRWLRPSARLHPTIHAFKKLLLRTHATQPLAMFVDLHGHSRKPNVFM